MQIRFTVFILATTVTLAAFSQETKTIDTEPPVSTRQSEKERAEQSVKPGINDRFLDPKLDVSEWLGRFEIESREGVDIVRHVAKQIGHWSGICTGENKEVQPSGKPFAVAH